MVHKETVEALSKQDCLVLVSEGLFEKMHKLVGFERGLHKIDGIWYWVVFADVPSSWHWIGADGTHPRTAVPVI